MKELVGKCGVVTLRGWEEARRAKVGEGCGEEKSAPELRRAIGSRCSGCQTFPEIDPRLQAHEKLDLPWGVPRRSWMVSEHFIGVPQSSHFRPLP